MICPKCKMKMNNEIYCIHCGYMTNGNVIGEKKHVPTMLELYFNEQYDKYTRNKNWIVSGIFGPVYIFCHGHYIAGLLLIILDYLISLFFIIFNHAFLYHYIVILLNVIYWVLNRFVWATIGNMIYLKLVTKRLNKIKNKDFNYYAKNIQQLYKKDNKLIVLKYIIFGILFIMLFYFIKKTIYDNLGLL